MMKGLMLIENVDSKNSVVKEPEISAMGIFKKYANLDLIAKEKDAWGEAVREKHVDY